MTTHYHFYCDESGEFEKVSSYKKSIVFGLLVPDEDKDSLAAQYQRLKLKYLFNIKNLHGAELYKDKNYQKFIEDLVSLTCSSSIKMVCIRHGRDLFRGIPGDIDECLACNRYLYMIQALVENFLFLHPPMWKEADFTFRHNTRVFPVKNDEAANRLKALGFYILPQKQGHKKLLANVWDTKGFMIFLQRLMVDYSPYLKTTGPRSIKNAEMQIAERSDDPFVHWADNLAGALLWSQDKNISASIKAGLETDAEYGEDHPVYKNLVMKFLEGRFDEFIPDALKKIGRFKNSYYTRQLGNMLDMSFDELEFDGESIWKLAAIVRDNIEKSSGQWNMVLHITEKLIGIAEKKSDNAYIPSAIKTLKSARLSCLNHRGDAKSAAELAATLENEKCETVDDLREKAEILNRLAVTGANRFDFISSAKALIPYLESLNNSRTELSKADGNELKDPQIGKIASTAGQAFAFEVPLDNEHFQLAEKLLIAAAREFSAPADILRQKIYLAHLYLDMNDNAKITEIFHEITNMPEVSCFIRNPLIKTPGAMAFVLALILKYEIQTGDKIFPEPSVWTMEKLPEIFPDNMNEHPFQFIFSYLGQIAFMSNDLNRAEKLFEKALSIPVKTENAPPVIKAIQCQILGIWALLLLKSGKIQQAVEKVHALNRFMNQIAELPENSSIITGEGNGWFEKVIHDIEKAVNEKNGIDAAVSAFLKKFTFNYR